MEKGPNWELGKQPKKDKRDKKHNTIKAAAASGVSLEGQRPPVQEDPTIPAFDADSRLLKTWTTEKGVIGHVFHQREDICASHVICRLLQAHHNAGKDVVNHHEFDVNDLANYIKKKTKRFSIRNLNIAFDYIGQSGLLKLGAGPQGLRVKAQFEENKNASKTDVFDKIEITPLGLALEMTKELHATKMNIYKVPDYKEKNDSKLGHIVLVVGKGTTLMGDDFLVVQNSWGKKWGNKGYARISLNPEERFAIFWPEEILKQ